MATEYGEVSIIGVWKAEMMCIPVNDNLEVTAKAIEVLTAKAIGFEAWHVTHKESRSMHVLYLCCMHEMSFAEGIATAVVNPRIRLSVQLTNILICFAKHAPVVDGLTGMRHLPRGPEPHKAKHMCNVATRLRLHELPPSLFGLHMNVSYVACMR